MSPPLTEPTGLKLTRAAKVVSRAFDEALGEAGGSLPVWVVLVSLKGQHHGMQRDLAQSIGIEGPTLTHHLNRMEAGGLVVRSRDPKNRRVHQVELTADGEALFKRLLVAVRAFDQRLRAGVTDEELAALGDLLDRFQGNVAPLAQEDAPAARRSRPRSNVSG
jgi:MarR family transcriptional regulator, transcriptional regulator for hemolysin